MRGWDMFIRLTPAQSTGIHGWGSRLKTTLNWRDIEDNDDIDFERLLKWQVSTAELKKLQPDVKMFVLHASCKPQHAVHLLPWPAHPIRDLHGDLADIIGLKATSRQLKAMGVTYRQLKSIGMTPETMRLLDIGMQGWLELGLVEADLHEFTDSQLARVFNMTRGAIMGFM